MQHDENIPTILRPQADAAVSWINETQARSYELTGLVDYEQALHAEAGEGYELGLVLCDGEICAREQVRVDPSGDGYQFGFVDAAEREIPPLLDPPVGVRSGWLEAEMGRHKFVVLLFYRGLW
ncbi:MAG: hypothetical protein CMP86_00795 [Gammaproteobacteria bacterium]|mgnify:FL=1|nr:hypothetical protein [Gammaproteobacteria bacterium]